jgi:hypothetical protein
LKKLTQFAPKQGIYAQAGVAQLVEQLICNQQVGGSNPSAGSILFFETDFRF